MGPAVNTNLLFKPYEPDPSHPPLAKGGFDNLLRTTVP